MVFDVTRTRYRKCPVFVVESMTAPFQHAMTTKAGCECMVHVLQSLWSDPLTTVTSVDEVSAFDLQSRESLLRCSTRVSGGGDVLPFVRQFCCQPSQYLWNDDQGITHPNPQGKGEKQRDVLMAPVPFIGPAFSIGSNSEPIPSIRAIFGDI